MKRQQIASVLLAALMMVVTAVVAQSIGPLPLVSANVETNLADSPFITEYPLPNMGAPRYLIRAADNGLWFTAPGVNAIGRFDTTSLDYTFYSIPTPNSDPYQLVSDGANIWFTQRAANKIGKLVIATGDITEYVVPTGNSFPTGITVAPNGIVWFVERAGNKLGKLDPTTESFTEYPYPRANSLLEDVVATSDGTMVWFTAPGVNYLVSFTFNTATFDETPTSDPLTGFFTPNQVALEANTIPWVSTTNGKIGRYLSTTTTYFRLYTVAPQSANLSDFLLVNNGNNLSAWFSDATTGYIGQHKTNAGGNVILSWRFPLANRTPNGLSVDDDDVLWIADGQNHMLIKWVPPYFYSTYLPIVNTS
jgi:virginiamycin B lyase